MLQYTLVTKDNCALIEVVFDILRKCGEQMYQDNGFEHWYPAYSMDAIRDDCHNKMVFLVWDKEQSEYVSTFQIYLEKNQVKPLVYIRKVATTPLYYGRGIGKQVLEFITDFSKKINIGTIALDVYDKSEQAIRFYLNNGFVVVGKRATRRFQVLLMEKNI